MDCIDCHNRLTHFVQSPDRALNEKLLTGQIPADLPYIKRVALAAITRNYSTTKEAQEGISSQLRQWYAVNRPELVAKRPELLEQAISGTQRAYSENVFPEMKVSWNTYPDFAGHRQNSGCFRCHDGSFETDQGATISRDCELCHIYAGRKRPEREGYEDNSQGEKRMSLFILLLIGLPILVIAALFLLFSN